jgi:hypothetical protein
MVYTRRARSAAGPTFRLSRFRPVIYTGEIKNRIAGRTHHDFTCLNARAYLFPLTPLARTRDPLNRWRSVRSLEGVRVDARERKAKTDFFFF